MRLGLATLLVLVLGLSGIPPATAAPAYRTTIFTVGSTTAQINGQPLPMDLAPFIDPATGRTYVPLRYLAAALGARVAWDQAHHTVTLTAPGTVVVLTAGSPVWSVDGSALTTDVAPRIVPPGRIVLPARRVAEAFGYTVHWLPAFKWVLVTNHPPPPGPLLSGPGAYRYSSSLSNISMSSC